MSFAALPELHIAWTQATPTGIFVQYNIYRQLAGEAAQMRLAVITNIATVTYDDYTVPSGVAATYAVTQVCNTSGTILESAQQTPVVNTVTFKDVFIHECANPTSYYAQLQGQTADVTPTQNIVYTAVAGVAARVALIGSEQWTILKITERLRKFSDSLVWTTLLNMFGRQRTAAAVFCLRTGQLSGRWFVNMNTGPHRTDAVSGYAVALDVTEVAYTETI